MKFLSISLCLGISLVSATAFAEETDDKQGLLPKVDKPIPETYEPLDGADWNHRTSQELKELREYQKQKKAKANSEYEARQRKELENKIQAPDPGAAPPATTPPVEDNNDRLRIRDPE